MESFLEKLFVHVHIVDRIGHVDIRQRFENFQEDPIELTYKFPLQRDASVHFFEGKNSVRTIHDVLSYWRFCGNSQTRLTRG
jgi:hypothetical protein